MGKFAHPQTPLGAKTIIQRAKSGYLAATRQDIWGLSEKKTKS
jgi:hypothetical protein